MKPAEAVRLLRFGIPPTVPFFLDKKEFQILFFFLPKLLGHRERDKWIIGGDDGLQFRTKTPKHPTRDTKVFFHYSYPLLDLLHKHRVYTNPFYNELATCKKVLDNVVEDARKYIAALDEEMPGYAFLRNFEAARHLHKLRIVEYDPPAKNNPVVAEKHTYFSFLTYHLWGSHEGIYTYQGKQWLPISHQKNIALLFLGRKASLMTGGKRILRADGTQSIEVDGGILPSIIHGVVENGLVTANHEKRRAVVGFLHVPLVL